MGVRSPQSSEEHKAHSSKSSHVLVPLVPTLSLIWLWFLTYHKSNNMWLSNALNCTILNQVGAERVQNLSLFIASWQTLHICTIKEALHFYNSLSIGSKAVCQCGWFISVWWRGCWDIAGIPICSTKNFIAISLERSQGAELQRYIKNHAMYQHTSH